jgi:hypothetical protein
MPYAWSAVPSAEPTHSVQQSYDQRLFLASSQHRLHHEHPSGVETCPPEIQGICRPKRSWQANRWGKPAVGVSRSWDAAGLSLCRWRTARDPGAAPRDRRLLSIVIAAP